MLAPHPDRARLYGEEAERYDRTRPGYPDELIEEVVGASPQRLSVLDVGCGTGIASRLMAARGAHVLGVELNAPMARGRQAERHPRRRRQLRDLGPGRLFDGVTSAQAWHWVDSVTGPAKAVSVLRRHGRLCVFWSVGHHPDQLGIDLERVYQRSPLRAPLRFGYGANRRTDPEDDYSPITDAIIRGGEFGPSEVRRFSWSRTHTPDHWVSQLRTHSDHAALPAHERASLFADIETVNRFDGSFTMSYTTILLSATRR